MKFYVYIWGFCKWCFVCFSPCAALKCFFWYLSVISLENGSAEVDQFAATNEKKKRRDDCVYWHMKGRAAHSQDRGCSFTHWQVYNHSTILLVRTIFNNGRRNVTTLFTSRCFSVYSRQHFTMWVKSIAIILNKSNQKVQIINYLMKWLSCKNYYGAFFLFLGVKVLVIYICYYQNKKE